MRPRDAGLGMLTRKSVDHGDKQLENTTVSQRCSRWDPGMVPTGNPDMIQNQYPKVFHRASRGDPESVMKQYQGHHLVSAYVTYDRAKPGTDQIKSGPTLSWEIEALVLKAVILALHKVCYNDESSCFVLDILI